MRIVILDAHTANPGDLDWQALAAQGELVVHARSTASEVVARAAAATAVLVNKVKLGVAEFAALPNLRYVGVLATGVNVVDLEAARQQGIAVSNVPGYSTASVAQLTMALLHELCLGVGRHGAANRTGAWSRSADFCWWEGRLVELAGLRLGLVGLGSIAQAVARIAQAYGMEVIACRRSTKPPPPGVALVDQATLFASCDVVSLHCPLTAENAGFVNSDLLATMKPGAFLINTARGGLLDEGAVAAALASGRLGGAGLDVLSAEPPPPGHPLISAPRCVITPHIGWATTAARQRLIAEVAANLAAWRRGEQRNRVS